MRHGPPPSSLRDHLIRPLQERWRNRQAEGLRGLEIDDQFELRRLLHRQVTRLGTPKNLNDVGCRAAIRIGHRNAIRNQAPPVYTSSKGPHGSQSTPQCEIVDQPAVGAKEERLTE